MSFEPLVAGEQAWSFRSTLGRNLDGIESRLKGGIQRAFSTELAISHSHLTARRVLSLHTLPSPLPRWPQPLLRHFLLNRI